jgi:hypothetical protein
MAVPDTSLENPLFFQQIHPRFGLDLDQNFLLVQPCIFPSLISAQWLLQSFLVLSGGLELQTVLG